MMTTHKSLSRFLRRGMSRRNLVHGTLAASTALGSGLWTPARADSDEDDRGRCGRPLPIPHTQPGPFGLQLHIYFPGPIDGSAVATDSTGTHAEGRDPSTITNFSGFVGQVDLDFSGTAIDTRSGERAHYTFHTDTRFIKGEFIGSDQQRHKGTF